MADPVIAEVNGLQNSNNTFSASPPGSLSVAREMVMPQKGVIEPRRGQARAYVPPSAAEKVFSIGEFQGSLIISTAQNKASDDYKLGVAGNPTVPFTGTFNPVDMDEVDVDFPPRMKFGYGESYLYFCTTDGSKALESTAGQPRQAGLDRMPDLVAAMDSASTADAFNWLPYGSSVAYRSVLRLPTTDGVSLLSPPSGRCVVSNSIVAPVGAMVRTGGTTVTVTFPGTTNPGLVTGDTFMLAPGETNFPAGSYTVASDTDNVITYASVGSNVSNTVAQDFDTGPRETLLRIALSADATVDTPVRIYRSLATTTADPSDEMFLVDEVFPTSTNITNGFIVYTDATPQSVINDPLYTNPLTGEGESQSNFAPPIYRDLAYWQDRMWYADITWLQEFNLQMLGVGSPNGIQDGDTITLNVELTDYTFTFKDAATLSTDVQIVSNGLPSFNIQQTSQNLVTAIHAVMRFNGLAVDAYNTSAEDEFGKIQIQSTQFGAGDFGVAVSRSESWTPAFVDDVTQGSVAERLPHVVAFSKLGQSESVPLVNRTPVGSKNYRALRVLALEQSLIVFKGGDGIYSLTGNYPFQVQQISVANLIAPDAACVFADNAWAYTDQGILRISTSGGATVVSRPIEVELNNLRAQFPTSTHDYAFMVPYEVERRLLVFVPFSEDDDGVPDLRAYVYNNATQAWTGPLYENVFSGLVPLSTPNLALGVYDESWATGRVTLERKGSANYLDYADANFTVTIVASTTDSSGNRVVRLASAGDVEAGDGLLQGDYRTKLKAARSDLGSRWFELYEDMPFAAGSATLYKQIDWEVQFLPGGNATARKTLTRLTMLFKPEWFEAYTGVTTVMTDQIQAEAEISTTSVGFGLQPFGSGPFGDPTPLAVDVNPIAAKWTNAAQFFIGMKGSEAWPKVRLQGFAMQLDTQAGPGNRGSR